MKILLTGATGFVGAALRQRLMQDQHSLVLVARQSRAADVMTLGDMGLDTNWERALIGCEVVVHLAARVHVMAGQGAEPASEFHRINVEGTAKLARQAATAGVKRFVFLSTIKVNGEATLPGRPFREDDVPAPKDAYGISKFEAEKVIRALAQETGMDVVILRSPLVYGPGAKNNFASLAHWVRRGIPLPLDMVRGNRRSMVALDNLVDLIVTCLDHPAAANEVFLAADGEDYSTAEWVERLAAAMGRSARLIPVPVRMLEVAAIGLGKREIARRLFGSLQVDSTKVREWLGWRPPITVDEGLQRAMESLCQER